MEKRGDGGAGERGGTRRHGDTERWGEGADSTAGFCRIRASDVTSDLLPVGAVPGGVKVGLEAGQRPGGFNEYSGPTPGASTQGGQQGALAGQAMRSLPSEALNPGKN